MAVIGYTKNLSTELRWNSLLTNSRWTTTSIPDRLLFVPVEIRPHVCKPFSASSAGNTRQ
jgi:hypothetical protein